MILQDSSKNIQISAFHMFKVFLWDNIFNDLLVYALRILRIEDLWVLCVVQMVLALYIVLRIIYWFVLLTAVYFDSVTILMFKWSYHIRFFFALYLNSYLVSITIPMVKNKKIQNCLADLYQFLKSWHWE